MDLRKSGYMVCTEILQLEESKIAQKFNTPVTEFKASYGHLQQFSYQWQPSIRRTIFQKLLEDIEENLINLYKFVILLRKKHGYLFSQIGNAEQTPIQFDI
jgi:hypothetical protein